MRGSRSTHNLLNVTARCPNSMPRTPFTRLAVAKVGAFRPDLGADQAGDAAESDQSHGSEPAPHLLPSHRCGPTHSSALHFCVAGKHSQS